MDNYKLRSELRELEEALPDSDGSSNFFLPKKLRNEIEEMTFKLDRAIATNASYRDVLRDVLK